MTYMKIHDPIIADVSLCQLDIKAEYNLVAYKNGVVTKSYIKKHRRGLNELTAFRSLPKHEQNAVLWNIDYQYFEADFWELYNLNTPSPLITIFAKNTRKKIKTSDKKLDYYIKRGIRYLHFYRYRQPYRFKTQEMFKIPTDMYMGEHFNHMTFEESEQIRLKYEAIRNQKLSAQQH